MLVGKEGRGDALNGEWWLEGTDDIYVTLQQPESLLYKMAATAFLPSLPLLLQLSSSLCSLSLCTITQCCWWRTATRAGGRMGPCFWSFSFSSHLEPSVGSCIRYAAISASSLCVSCAIKRAFVSIDEGCRVVGALIAHVQRQILQQWLHNISESWLLTETWQLG